MLQKGSCMRSEQMTKQQAKRSGYCIVSRRKPTHAARIDRKDWKEHMASMHAGGMEWVRIMGKDAADFYRRCYSKDVIVVPSSWAKELPNSGNGPAVFVSQNNRTSGA